MVLIISICFLPLHRAWPVIFSLKLNESVTLGALKLTIALLFAAVISLIINCYKLYIDITTSIFLALYFCISYFPYAGYKRSTIFKY